MIVPQQTDKPDEGPGGPSHIAQLIRDRPLPRPSAATSRSIIEAARQNAGSGPHVEERVSISPRARGRSVAAWSARTRRPRALAAAACVALGLAVWFALARPRNPAGTPPDASVPVAASGADSGLEPVDGRLADVRHRVLRLRSARRLSARFQPPDMGERLARLRSLAQRLRKDVVARKADTPDSRCPYDRFEDRYGILRPPNQEV